MTIPVLLSTILNDLSSHAKIFNIEASKEPGTMLTCEVDSIQCTAKMMVSRILKKHGTYPIRSTTIGAKKFGATAITVLWG